MTNLNPIPFDTDWRYYPTEDLDPAYGVSRLDESSWGVLPSLTDWPRDLIAMVKVNAAETLGRVVDRAVQIFGGMGFCKDLAIERYYRDARIYRIFDGTSEIHRTVIARGALRRGAAAWDIGA